MFTKKRVKWIVIAVVVLAMFTFASFRYTSTSNFCASCHVMEPSYETWEKSEHFEKARCIDCHGEPGIGPYLYEKIKGIYKVGLVLTNDIQHEGLEADVSSQTCLECHVEFEGIEDENVRSTHKEYVEEGQSCLECHGEVGHTR